MALLLGCQKITKAYGAAPLVRDLSFGIHDGDRIGLVGPNGCGKSTLLRVLAGLESPDEGTVALRRLTRLEYVPQHPRFAEGRTVFDLLAEALAADGLDDATRDTRVRTTLGRCGFTDTEAPAATLSGGWQKRLAIARALVREPDLLLLDEPTNHLDLEGILWLEQLLTAEPAACLVVSHDRWFLENVAQRMLDLDPVHASGFFETRGRYSEFLERKDAALREQAHWQETLANRVRREVDWLRHGPKARTTKSQARIQEAGRMIDELASVQARTERRTAAIDFSATDRRTKRLLVAEQAGKSFGTRRILDGVDVVLGPGTRLGLLGPNGSGKSTLIRLLTGEIEPDSGRITRADGLRVAMLDQHRALPDPSLTLRRALAPSGGDQVVFGDRPIHVVGWARRFLFKPEQLSMPVGKLSGGEQARVLLATLMLQPADLLVLDEPTNDLDIPTLEVLEESLLDFPGAIVLVTHDRYLFERVTTTVLALDGTGVVTPFADYRQWEAERRVRSAPKPRAVVAPVAAPSPPKAPARRLGYTEQRELDGMERAIMEAEERLGRCQAAANDPDVATRADELAARCHELTEAQAAVDTLYARWAELEKKRG
ncbi:MAG TPA: ABC-F family ATP-binding cassette domain-containing protein [Candidatus Binatia bacterium]|jgi:ATP-binding cassette subfamily F protein uup|nr:ABC-F family ATP-binding cassette domain-containing protein [Candidatus Binatia bacterium]